MQRPKQLPHEALSEIAVSAATKLQRLRHLGRYFKQSSKSLEQQVTREARFYGSLIRLQQNWKVKKLRLGFTGPGSENFTIDLLDKSMADLILSTRSSTLSSVRIDHDLAGNLTVELPSKLCRSLYVGFPGFHSSNEQKSFIKRKIQVPYAHSCEDKCKALTTDDINKHVKYSHLVLRKIQLSIFQEQVFDLVYYATYNPSRGVNVVAMREDFLHLSIGHETSVSLCLLPSVEEESIEKTDSAGPVQKRENGVYSPNSLGLLTLEEKQDRFKNCINFCDPVCLEIYLQHLFHKNIFLKAKDKNPSTLRLQAVGQPAGSESSLLGHFCMTIAHRIFSKKVLSVLEGLVEGVPYLHLLSHPTWHSRISSWSLSLKVPQSILHSSRRIKQSEGKFHTKVVVKDDQISISGDGAPSIVGSLRGNHLDACSINSYGCDLVDLPMVILQQVAGQVIHWIYEESLVVGMKVSRDFLCLFFDLDQGETLGLVANVDAEDIEGCISWWLVFDDGFLEEGKFAPEVGDGKNRRFLGHLSLEALYSTVMDLVTLCSTGSH